MNLLAVDYGKKNIGLAWTDTAIGVVLPFGVIANKESIIKNQELIELIKKERVEKIILGLPLGLDGEENENTKKVRTFGDELKKETGLSVEFIDERFTSRLADAMGGGATRDEKAAMGILQSYLDRQNKS